MKRPPPAFPRRLLSDMSYENMRCETKRMFRILYLISQISLSQILSGQSRVMDSMELALKNAKHDTVRCNLLFSWSDALYTKNPDSALGILMRSKEIAEQNITINSLKEPERKTFKRQLSEALNNIGYIYQTQGQISDALACYGRSIKIQEELGDKHGIAYSLNNIGFIYDNQSQVKEALDYYGKSLKIQEEISDKQGTANSLNNIGYIYQSQSQVKEALDYFSRSLEIRKEIGDKSGEAESLSNIGSIFLVQGKVTDALQYFSRSIKMDEESGNKFGIAYSLVRMGNICFDRGQEKSALDYYNKSLKIREEIGDKKGIANSLCSLGKVYLKLNQRRLAMKHGIMALWISKEIGYPENILKSAKLLSEIYETQGNGTKALEMYKLYIQMHDSILNTENKKKTIQQQFKYEYEKKAAADSVAFAKSQEVKNAQIEKQNAELKSKRTQQYFLFGGLGLVVVFAGFMYNRFRVTQKQKRIIEEQKFLVEKQKLLVEEKQEEILDSIHYAKRIQTALLTSERYIARKLIALKEK